MYISLHELGFFLVVVMVLMAGSFLLVTLANLNRLVTHLHKTLTENSRHVQGMIEDISESAANVSVLTGVLRKNQQLFEEKIPGSINNIYAITTALKKTGEKAEQSLEIVHGSLVETAATVTESTRDLLTYLRVVSEGIRIIIATLLRK
ncbi:MAG: hypothetical protein ACYCXI_06220 [Dethiobacteraceae bacterium]|jgi:hypothetical protein